VSIDYLEKLYDLSGKVAVVTGGGGVLCGAMCRAFSQVGIRVAVLDLNGEAAQKVTGDIRAAGGEALAIQADVLSKDSLERARQELVTKFGQVDILINGAGGNNPQATTSTEQPFFDLPTDAIRWVFDLNFMGTLIPCQVFGRVMAEQGEGCIINIETGLQVGASGFEPVIKGL
jgi:NAD(P)-dependent dehydrogenase (short-subunit alcohol dehydrogenase family)